MPILSNISYHMVYQVRIYTSNLCSYAFSGEFNATYEDVRSGRIWQGVIKYIMGALVETNDTPPEHKVFVSFCIATLETNS